VRDDKRGPGLRGNILVEEGDPASTSGAPAPAGPAGQSSAEQPSGAAPEQDSEGGQAEPEPEAGPFLGTIPEDAGTHATGPNPVVKSSGAIPNPTAPIPVVGAEPEAVEAEPEAKPQPEAEPEAKAEPAPEAVPEAAAEHTPEAQVKPEAQAEAQAEPEARAEPEAPVKPDPAARPGVQPAPKAQPDADADADPVQSGAVVEPAHIAPPAPVSPGAVEWRRVAEPGPEPSWGKVLATTISLWASRRFGRGRARSGSPPGTVAVYGGTDAPAPSSRWGGVRWPLVVFVLLLVILALVGLQLSGALNTSSPSQPAAGSGGTGGNSGSGGSLAGATAARNHAAGWIAQQVTSSDLIACDPLMCSTLQDEGVAASRLMPIEPTSTDPLNADVVAATSTVRSQFGSRLVSEYAPELIATFGSGTSRVDVRAVANYGAAAFNTKEQADLAARKAAGAQLLRNGFHVPAPGASQIRAGQVDSRLLVTLAALLSQRAVQVSSFGDTGPGAPVLYRQVTVVNASGQTGTSALNADLKQVQTQRNSYLPAHAKITRLAKGQSALRIQFGAPDQPGLLSGGNS
jgi:hypothetical protein